MKNKTTLFLTVIATLLISLTAFPERIIAEENADTDLSEVLPEDSILFINIPGFYQSLENIKDTPLGQTLTNEYVAKYMQDMWKDKAFAFAHLATFTQEAEGENFDINVRTNKILKDFEVIDPLLSLLNNNISIGIFTLGDTEKREIFCLKISNTRNLSNKDIYFMLRKTSLQEISWNETNDSQIIMGKDLKLFISATPENIIVTNEKNIAPKYLIPALQNGGLSGSLAKTESFSELRNKITDKNNSIFLYIKPEAMHSEAIGQIINWVSEIIELPLTENDKTYLANAKKTLNLSHVEHVAFGGKKTGNLQIKHTFSVKYKETDKNLNLPTDADNFELRNAANILPSGSEYFLSFKVPSNKVYSYITDKIKAFISPVSKQEFSATIEKIKTDTGTDIKKELSSILGNNCTIFPADNNCAARAFPPNFILKINIIDKQRLEKILSSMRIISSPLGWRKTKSGETDIYYINRFKIPFPLAPAYMIKDMDLFIATYPQQLKNFLLRQSTSEKRLAADELYAKAMPDIDMGANTALGFFNSSNEPSILFEESTKFLYALNAIKGYKADPAIIPPACDIVNTWGPTAFSVKSSPQETCLEITGPAGLLSPALWVGGQMANELRGRKGIINSVFTMIAITPYIERKEKAEQKQKSYNRLKKLGEAYVRFLNDRQIPPQNLDELINNNYILKEETFIPSENSKYQYAMIKPAGRFKPTIPIMHEPILKESTGVYVLFADGHVEWITRWRLEKILGILPMPADGSPPMKSIEIF